MSVHSNKPSTPAVYNKAMTTGGTEYSQALPLGTQKFTFKLRSTVDAAKVCYTSGASGTTYITVPTGTTYSEDGLGGQPITLYFQSATSAMVAEIVAWS